MVDSLHPLAKKELLSKTLTIYGRNFAEFAGLSIVGSLATLAYRLRFDGGMTALLRLHSTEASPAVAAVLGGIAIVMIGVVVSSAATVVATAAASRGCKVQVAEAYRALRKRRGQIIGIILSVLLRACPGFGVCIAAGLVALAAAAALGYNSRVEAGIIGYICAGFSLISATFATLWICARYAVAAQASVVEGISSKLALKRSAFLTAGDRGRVTIVHFLFLILLLTTDFIFGTPALLLPVQGAAFRISSALSGFFAVVLISPLMAISMSLVYYDERSRKEGFSGHPSPDYTNAA